MKQLPREDEQTGRAKVSSLRTTVLLSLFAGWSWSVKVIESTIRGLLGGTRPPKKQQSSKNKSTKVADWWWTAGGLQPPRCGRPAGGAAGPDLPVQLRCEPFRFSGGQELLSSSLSCRPRPGPPSGSGPLFSTRPPLPLQSRCASPVSLCSAPSRPRLQPCSPLRCPRLPGDC